MKLRLTIAFVLGGFVASLFAFLFLHWYVGGGTSVTFENRSAVVLQQVEITGSGFKATIWEVRPGETAKVRVYPYGESGLGVAFIANGHRVAPQLDEYLEDGYRVHIVIDTKLAPSVVVDDFSVVNLLLP